MARLLVNDQTGWMRLRPVVLVSLLVATAFPASAGAAAKPVGFQVDLKGGDHVECGLVKSTLSCLNYGETPSGACDAGGPVAGLVLTLNATKPKAKTFCVDEGYHGWSKLKAGKTWSKGGFSCRLAKGSASLSCRNAKGNHKLWPAS